MAPSSGPYHLIVGEYNDLFFSETGCKKLWSSPNHNLAMDQNGWLPEASEAFNRLHPMAGICDSILGSQQNGGYEIMTQKKEGPISEIRPEQKTEQFVYTTIEQDCQLNKAPIIQRGIQL